MEYRYLIDLNNPDDQCWPIQIKRLDGTLDEEMRTITYPVGGDRMFAATNSTLFKSTEDDLHYHQHAKGYETFFLDAGGLDLVIGGKFTHVEPGSLVHMSPYQAHGTRFTDDTKYRGFFCTLLNLDNVEAFGLARKHNPELMDGPNWASGPFEHPDFVWREPLIEWEEVTPQEHPAVRHRDWPMRTFRLEGATLKQLVGRWEIEGLREIWAAELEKGFWAKSQKFPYQRTQYYVWQGEVRFKVYDTEFIAKAENVVDIPKFAQFELEALTDAIVYDVGGTPMWEAFLEDRASILKRAPERWADLEERQQILDKFGVPFQSFGKN